MENTLLDQLEDRGYRAGIVSIRRLDDLREAIQGRYRQGLLDESFYQARLAGYTFRPPEQMPDARSLIVVAYRDPPVRLTFRWAGRAVPLVVPPTYLNWREKDGRVGAVLAGLLEPVGHRLTQAFVPKKLLAVCGGLALYGRNNITYVEGMGSYHRLAAFCSDLPCEGDGWREPKALELCERCAACLRACPTGAIAPDRFLLRAERCLTFLNEQPGEVAFPDWLDPAAHNCLVGCMRCQTVCPENRSLQGWYQEGAEFSEEETALLLAGLPMAELPAALAEKLEQWDPEEWVGGLPRNLKVLLTPPV